jgi:hypothetical protein
MANARSRGHPPLAKSRQTRFTNGGLSLTASFQQSSVTRSRPPRLLVRNERGNPDRQRNSSWNSTENPHTPTPVRLTDFGATREAQTRSWRAGV